MWLLCFWYYRKAYGIYTTFKRCFFSMLFWSINVIFIMIFEKDLYFMYYSILILIFYIYGPVLLDTPPPTPWLWVCIVAPQYPSPPCGVGGGGGGRSCICMYMNVYVWCECMFLVFVYDYDMYMNMYVYMFLRRIT